MTARQNALLSVTGLRTCLPAPGSWLRRREPVPVVDGVDLQVRAGEVLGLVGESGGGKTTLARSILRLVQPEEGRVVFDGIDVLPLPARRMRELRKRMQIVFQNPFASLNPRMTVGSILAEPLAAHGVSERSDRKDRVRELLQSVGLATDFSGRYPAEMSGGQRQRVAIARALALRPDFLIADEPVASLDVSVQAQILRLLQQLGEEQGLSMLFISHDLAVVEKMADRIAVMYRGKIVEDGETSQVILTPSHEYTRRLLQAAR